MGGETHKTQEHAELEAEQNRVDDIKREVEGKKVQDAAVVFEQEPKPEKAALAKTITRAKDSRGRFISKRERLGSEQYTIKRREFLEKNDPRNPKKTRAEVIDEALYELVQLGTTDPKYSTAAVNAAKQLAERAHGRTPPSDKELDRITAFPVKMVIVAPIEGLKMAEEERNGPRRPNFAEEVPGSMDTIEGEYQK